MNSLNTSSSKKRTLKQHVMARRTSKRGKIDDAMEIDSPIGLLDLHRLVHVMETDPAPSDRSWRDILMRADLCRNMTEKLKNNEGAVDAQLSRRVEAACQRAEEVAAELKVKDDAEDIVQKIFFKQNGTANKAASGEEDKKEAITTNNTSDTKKPKAIGKKSPQNKSNGTATKKMTTKDTVPAAPSVEDLQKQQREQIESAVSAMASQMKEQTAKLHSTLSRQTDELGQMESVAADNVAAVTDIADATQQHVKKSWGGTVTKWTAFLVIAAAFVGTLLTIQMVPKRPGACLFFCAKPETQFCRVLPGGRKECFDAPPSEQQREQPIKETPSETRAVEKEDSSKFEEGKTEKVQTSDELVEENKEVDDEVEEEDGDDEEEEEEEEDDDDEEEEEEEEDDDDDAVLDDTEDDETAAAHSPIPFDEAAAAAANGNFELLHSYLKQTPELLNQQDANGWGLVHEAARNGHTETVRVLLEQDGCEHSLRTNAGQTPLDLAMDIHALDHPTIVLLKQAMGLLEDTVTADVGCEVGMDGECIKHTEIKVPVDTAEAREAALREFDQMQNNGNAQQEHKHQDANNAARVPSEAMSSAPMVDGKPFSSKDFRRAASRGDVRRMAGFLEVKPDFIDEIDQNGWNALHLAVRGGFVEIVKMLLEAGADAAVETRTGHTALELADMQYGADADMTQLIEDYE